MTRIRLSSLAFVLLPVWAEAFERPAVTPQRQKVERRLERLDARLVQALAEGPRAEANLDLARRNADFARKLLKVNNVRAAELMTRSAERFLGAAESAEVEGREVQK